MALDWRLTLAACLWLPLVLTFFAQTPFESASVPTADATTALDAALETLAATDVPLPREMVTDGMLVVRDAQGTIVAEGPMVAGERTGLWRRYDHAGQRLEEGEYAHDRPTGRWQHWPDDSPIGFWLDAVPYREDACAVSPRIELLVYCGNAFEDGHAPPTDWSQMSRLRELGRCVGVARPWVDDLLAGPTDNWRVLAEANVEIIRLVESIVEEGMARAIAVGPRNLARWEHEQITRGVSVVCTADPLGCARLVELAITHPRELGGVTDVQLIYVGHVPVTVGAAARSYRSLREIGPEGYDDRGWYDVFRRRFGASIVAIIDAHPDLVLPLTDDAVARVGADHWQPDARLRGLRVEAFLADGHAQRAERELDMLAAACRGCVSQVAELRSTIAARRLHAPVSRSTALRPRMPIAKLRDGPLPP